MCIHICMISLFLCLSLSLSLHIYIYIYIYIYTTICVAWCSFVSAFFCVCYTWLGNVAIFCLWLERAVVQLWAYRCSFLFVAVCSECSLLLHGCIAFVGIDYCAFCRPGVPKWCIVQSSCSGCVHCLFFCGSMRKAACIQQGFLCPVAFNVSRDSCPVRCCSVLATPLWACLGRALFLWGSYPKFGQVHFLWSHPFCCI